MSEVRHSTKEERPVVKVTPEHFAWLRKAAVDQPDEFDQEMERLRQQLNVPVGTEVSVEVIHE